MKKRDKIQGESNNRGIPFSNIPQIQNYNFYCLDPIG